MEKIWIAKHIRYWKIKIAIVKIILPKFFYKLYKRLP